MKRDRKRRELLGMGIGQNLWVCINTQAYPALSIPGHTPHISLACANRSSEQQMPDTAPLKAISLKLEPELLERIKSEAAARGTNVSAFIRGCVLSCLPGSSADASLTEQIQTLDPRAKGVIKDVLRRLDALEKEVFSD